MDQRRKADPWLTHLLLQGSCHWLATQPCQVLTHRPFGSPRRTSRVASTVRYVRFPITWPLAPRIQAQVTLSQLQRPRVLATLSPITQVLVTLSQARDTPSQAQIGISWVLGTHRQEQVTLSQEQAIPSQVQLILRLLRLLRQAPVTPSQAWVCRQTGAATMVRTWGRQRGLQNLTSTVTLQHCKKTARWRSQPGPDRLAPLLSLAWGFGPLERSAPLLWTSQLSGPLELSAPPALRRVGANGETRWVRGRGLLPVEDSGPVAIFDTTLRSGAYVPWRRRTPQLTPQCSL